MAASCGAGVGADVGCPGLGWITVAGALGASLVGTPLIGSAARMEMPADRHAIRSK